MSDGPPPTTPPVVTRDARGRWLRGPSPNPKGKPPNPAGYKEMLQAATIPALEALIEIVANKKHPRRLDAAIAILNRRFGMPKQAIDIEGEVAVDHQAAVSFLVSKLSRLGGQPSPTPIDVAAERVPALEAPAARIDDPHVIDANPAPQAELAQLEPNTVPKERP